MMRTRASVIIAGCVALMLGIPSTSQGTGSADEEIRQCHKWSQSGLHTQAARVCEEALRKAESVYPDSATFLLYPLSDLTTIYFALGDYRSAERVASEAMKIGASALGSKDPRKATLMTALAAVYQQQARYTEAESLYRRALSVTQDAFGPEHPEVATVLHNLALLQQAQGRYDAAVLLLQRSLLIRESHFGRSDQRVGVTMLALAAAYQQQGLLAEAMAPSERALAIYRYSYGPKSAQLVAPLQNLAGLLHMRGQLKEAEPVYKDALTLLERSPETPQLDLARLSADLGLLYHALGQYTLARGLLQRALGLRERILGENHPLVAESLHNLAILSLSERQPELAAPLLWRAVAILESGLRLTVSEAQSAALLEQQQGIEASVYGALLEFPNVTEFRQLAMTVALLRKGRTEEAGRRTNLAVLASTSSEKHAAMLSEWQKVRAERERLILQGAGSLHPAEYRARFDVLRLRIEDLELALLSSVELPQIHRLPKPKDIISQISAKLDAGRVLIEFVWTRPLRQADTMPGSVAPHPHYLALVLRHTGEVQSFDLGEALLLDQQIGELLKRLQDRATDPRPAAQAVYQSVFASMKASLQSTRQVCVSAEGSLHMIPFSALFDGTRYLIDQLQFVYLSSGRDLLESDSRTPGGPPVVIADPEFASEMKPGASNGDPQNGTPGPDGSASAARGAAGFYSALSQMTRLPGTRKEAELLSKLWPHAKLLLGRDAEETAVRGLAAPEFLHIATHGVFLEDQPPSEAGTGLRGIRALVPLPVAAGSASSGGAPAGKEPNVVQMAGGDRTSALSRSALLLAGVESAHLSADRSHDGLLTAEEVRDMNLWGTKLVVLSACESGRGAIRTGQGVYGLRRAFFAAGAETLVTSLWRVSDSETSELMDQYYRRLAAGAGRIAALGEAMAAVRKRHPHPYYWAPFIGIGRDGPIRDIADSDVMSPLGPSPDDEAGRKATDVQRTKSRKR